MQHSSRRIALGQMAALFFGSSIVMEGCGPSHSKDSIDKTEKSLKTVHIPSGSFPKAPDGVSFGDGVKTGAKVRSEYTNGQLCCQEIYLKAKQAGPPPHLHKELDEVMRVVEGTVHVLVGDTVTALKAGDWHVRPHGLVHTFWNASDQPALCIDLYLNQDFLSFFEEFMRIMNQLQKKGLTLESNEGQKLNNALLAKYGIEMFPEQFPPIIAKYGLTM
ncbi:cupin domain-containing protein [Rhodocytophaga rosea]|uniref:Cupin domain-containing protein n=1 Tax=Rhodocytophaga rosea TaxID=2704465 RepID=A0A6C0GJL7_9BACT|nr:cupin domain-containing protein [Rhodocytophaga rosea]QHT67852.1 cupin domain-containing protein [Rhodocytophaga rosea]